MWGIAEQQNVNGILSTKKRHNFVLLENLKTSEQHCSFLLIINEYG